MRLTLESLVEGDDFLVDHHLANYDLLELLQFCGGGQTSVQQQIGGLHVGGVISQLVNRVAPVHELTLLPVDVSDVRDAARSAHESGVIGQHSKIGEQSSDVDHFWSQSALQDGQLNLLAVNSEDSFLFLGLWLFWSDQRDVRGCGFHYNKRFIMIKTQMK